MSARQADRADPFTLVPAARALYEQGKDTRQVLAEIYGVSLPEELFSFYEAFVRPDEGLSASWLNHPWELMVPPQAGGPNLTIGPKSAQQEAAAFAQAPHVLLLCVTGYDEAKLGSTLVGYDLDEVRQGRSTIVGLPRQRQVPVTGAEFNAIAPSLVELFIGLIEEYRDLAARWMSTGSHMYGPDEMAELIAPLSTLSRLRSSVAT